MTLHFLVVSDLDYASTAIITVILWLLHFLNFLQQFAKFCMKITMIPLERNKEIEAEFSNSKKKIEVLVTIILR